MSLQLTVKLLEGEAIDITSTEWPAVAAASHVEPYGQLTERLYVAKHVEGQMLVYAIITTRPNAPPISVGTQIRPNCDLVAAMRQVADALDLPRVLVDQCTVQLNL